MSLYCRGRECDRKDKCLRYERGKEFNGQTVEGLWYVDEPSCKTNWYCDFVDHDGNRSEKWKDKDE